MKLEVPFYKQETNYDCGPTALLMCLDFIGNKKYSREEIQSLVDSEKSGVTMTIALAVASARLGFETELYTKHLGFNPSSYNLEFYKKLLDGEDKTKLKIEKLKSEAIHLGVKLEEKTLTSNQIFEKMGPYCVPLILLDWNKILSRQGYQGHFVPIVGYDEDFVYVHNPGNLGTKDFMAIKRDLFDISRKSEGTDEDIIFIKFDKNLTRKNL